GTVSTSKVQIGSLQATKLTIKGQSFAVYWVVTGGKLEVSTSQAGLTALQGSGRLSDDSAYKDAVSAAGVPGQVSTLLYSDVQTAVPFGINLAGSASAETQANLKPLRSVVAYSTQDGDVYQVSGFVGI